MNNFITNRIPHYYGDIVRFLFLFGAVVMLIGLPSLSNYLNIPTIFSVASILVLGLAAGITNPRQIWGAAVNVVISAAAFVVFESYAVDTYRRYGVDNRFFNANLVLGLIFLFALYFSVKTLRGLWLEKR